MVNNRYSKLAFSNRSEMSPVVDGSTVEKSPLPSLTTRDGVLSVAACYAQ